MRPAVETATAVPPWQRGVALVLWLALLGVCLVQVLRTPFVADLSAFLPADPDPQQQLLIEQVQSGLPARTLLLAIEGGDARERAAASSSLAQALRASELFEQVQNGQTETFGEVGAWLFENRYLLSPAVEPQRFTAPGLREGLAETLSLLGTPAGNRVKPLLERDPTGETVRIAEGLIPASAPRSEEGVWASRQGERALLVASTRAAGADLDAQARAIQQVRDSFAALQAPALVLQVSGAPVFGVTSRALIEAEVRWLAIAGTVMVGSVLLLAFASLPALLVALLPVATGVLVGIATVGTVFGVVHGITLGFGATLIGEAVDYAIYYLVQARQGGWRHWRRSGWPTVRLGLLTSVCGFSALLFSGFPGLMQLGTFSLAGLLGAALFTRFVMPALMPDGASGTGLRRQLGRFGAGLVAFMPQLRWPLLALGLAAAVLLTQRGELWRAELTALSPIPAEALALDASLRADLSAGDATTLVVVQGADEQSVLRAAEAAGARLDTLQQQGAIGGYSSVARWVPSLATQQARQASLPDTATLQAALEEATRGGPLSAQRLSPFLDEVQRARSQPLVTPATLRGTAAQPLVQALLLQRADGSWAALLPLEPAGERLDLEAVRRAVLDLPQTQVIAIGSELTRLYERYLGQAQTQALLGAAGVVLLMALALRSWRRLLAVCQPLLLAVLITMGTLAAFNVHLGILHLVGLLLVVAVGSNYALFFDLLRHQGVPDEDTLASLLLANLTTVLSFGLIGLSAIPALSAIGLVVAPGALLSLLLAAAFVPSPGAAGAVGVGGTA